MHMVGSVGSAMGLDECGSRIESLHLQLIHGLLRAFILRALLESNQTT